MFFNSVIPVSEHTVEDTQKCPDHEKYQNYFFVKFKLKADRNHDDFDCTIGRLLNDF